MDKAASEFESSKVAKITEELQNLGVYEKLISATEQISISAPLGQADFLGDLQNALRQGGIETCIRNALVLAKRKQDVKDERENLIYMKKAQNHFERKITKAILSLHKELKFPLIRTRTPSEVQELAAKWDELSSCGQELGPIKHLYSPKDLYDAIASIRDPDNIISRLEEKWSVVKIPMSVPTFEELQEVFADLCNGDEPFLGLGPTLVSENNANVTLLNHRISLGNKVVTENDILLSEEFVKSGCPPHLRGTLWKQILQLNIGEKEKEYFQARRQSFLQTEYLIDKIIVKDIQLTASRDEHYFVFEDLVYQVALSISRDPFVCQQLCAKLGTRPHSRHVPFQIPGQASAFPPSGFIPFHGWAMYVAPLCYVYEETEDIYYAVRSLYLKYWYRLHRISSHGQGIVALSILFEKLLQQLEPELWMHCLNNNIEPLKIAFPWLVQAFSGYLVPEQLLYLWDLMLGFDSLYLLPLLAASIFSLRRENLHRVETEESAESVCQDLSTIKVIPLLQMVVGQKGRCYD